MTNKKEYYQKNRERIIEYNKNRYHLNKKLSELKNTDDILKQNISEKNRKYYERNKKKIRERQEKNKLWVSTAKPEEDLSYYWKYPWIYQLEKIAELYDIRTNPAYE